MVVEYIIISLCWQETKNKFILCVATHPALQKKHSCHPLVSLDIAAKIHQVIGSAFYNLLGEKNECYY